MTGSNNIKSKNANVFLKNLLPATLRAQVKFIILKNVQTKSIPFVNQLTNIQSAGISQPRQIVLFNFSKDFLYFFFYLQKYRRRLSSLHVPFHLIKHFVTLQNFSNTEFASQEYQGIIVHGTLWHACKGIISLTLTSRYIQFTNETSEGSNSTLLSNCVTLHSPVFC